MGLNFDDYTLQDRGKLTCFHSLHNKWNAGSLFESLDLQQKLFKDVKGLDFFIHSHSKLGNQNFSKIVLLNRNPLDYAVSSYFFHYKNRGHSITFKDAFPKIVEQFAQVIIEQKSLLQEKKAEILEITYEELMRNKESCLKVLLNFSNIEYNETAFNRALENIDINSFRKMEGGKALIAPKTFTGGSFIRSGKVGEWKEFFEKSDLKVVEDILKIHELKLSDYELE